MSPPEIDAPRDDWSVSDVTIRRDDDVTITYDDGAVATFGVGELRAACPCATCRGRRERGETVWPPSGGPASGTPAISIRDASFSGAWGISISWSDGHDTGIYPWSALRRWWDAGFDQPLTEEADHRR